jgi:hypothetical protein
MLNKCKEYALPALILASFITYYFDFLKDGMMISGIFSVLIMLYIGILWREQIKDERDDFIRSKVDRYLFISTLGFIFIDILYKTYNHQSYMSEVIILTALSLLKIILSKTIDRKH